MREVDDPRFIVELLRDGSLAATARRLGVTPSAVTQRLQGLEARLGVRLLDRSTRRIRLTDEGALFHEHALRLTRDYDDLVDTLRSRKALVRGRLSVHGPLGFGRHHVAPLVARFRLLHPQLEIMLTLSDRRIDPEKEAFDVVLHIGELRDSSQVAFNVAPNRRILCAAPAYLRRAGVPQTPEALAQHDCLVLRENNEDTTLWRFSSRQRETAVRVGGSLACNDGEVIRDWALAGQGLMLRSEWDVAAHLRSGHLVEVMPAWRAPAADVIALIARRQGTSARVRAYLDFLRGEFRPRPPWRTA